MTEIPPRPFSWLICLLSFRGAVGRLEWIATFVVCVPAFIYALATVLQRRPPWDPIGIVACVVAVLSLYVLVSQTYKRALCVLSWSRIAFLLMIAVPCIGLAGLALFPGKDKAGLDEP